MATSEKKSVHVLTYCPFCRDKDGKPGEMYVEKEEGTEKVIAAGCSVSDGTCTIAVTYLKTIFVEQMLQGKKP
ncbi:MAG TPA: hypothetical protein V6C82_09830 [Chroococcales cyanobacterium]